MDDRRFDALTRAMAQGVSRRMALKGLLGSLVGGAAVATRLDLAGAQGQCEDSRDCPYDICSFWDCIENQCVLLSGCDQGQTCCDFTASCINADQCCDDFECSDFDCQICSTRTHTCVSECADGESCCFGTCYDPASGCCDSTDCGPAPDACSSYSCPDYTCELESNCSDSETCCSEGTCASASGCCADSDCTEPCSVCSANVCVSTCTDEGTICCDNICYNGDSCCLDAGEQCDASQLQCCEDLQCCSSSGECAVCCVDDECPVNHFCCEAGGAGAHCEFCCENSQCEGEFGYCDEGQCYLGECNVDSDCGACQSCFQHQCFQIGCLDGYTCCGGHECVPEDECCIPPAGACADQKLSCCDDLLCCRSGDSSYCAACCDDSDCGDCEICDSGVCAPVTDCCKGPGESCGAIVPTAEDADQHDCCDGLVCCYGQSANICAQCCIDENCDAGGTCENWVCVYPVLCTDDKGCPEHTCCCDDGSCSWHCCDHHHHPHPKPPKPAPDAPVTTLPATGSGQQSTSSGLFGTAALGAAAALFAAKKLRENPAPQTEE